MKPGLLVVDDDDLIRESVAAFMAASGFQVWTAADVASAQIAFRSRRPDAAIIDFMLPDGSALDLLERFKAVDPSAPVIVLTGHGSIDIAVRAVQEGAAQFLTKPIDLPALLTVVQRSLETQSIRRIDTARRAGSAAKHPLDPFLGASAAIRSLEARVRKVLASESPVIITGETGSGKGVLARWMHEHGPRANAPFVDLNCAGLSREFLDTELFGHEKGAFTGAVSQKQGLFEVAHTGTMFLDEVGDVDLQLQPKLLKVVEEKRFRRLGEVSDRTVDVRLIGATHRNLEAMAKEGRFRSDLYFRLSTIPVEVPPLRERTEDIPILAVAILQALSRTLGRPLSELTQRAVAALQRYPWTGNLRELRNVLERAMLLTDVSTIDEADLHLAETPRGAGDDADLELTLDEIERRHIERVFNASDGQVDRAAARLGISRSSLYNKIKQYGIRSSKI